MTRTTISALTLLAMAFVSGCNDGRPKKGPKKEGKVLNEQTIESPGTTKITGEIWVDNWFALSVNGKPLMEDGTPFNTERSFNAERVTFSADLPATLAFEVRDFKENDTGLEYIGSNRQQMGDGGFIAQFRNAADQQSLGVTNSSMRCLTIHRAPLDRACAKEDNPIAGEAACQFTTTAMPENWTAPDFDDSAWPTATEHTARAVSPKDGYDAIEWTSSAKLIWSDDLVQDNTLLCRMVLK